MGARGKKQNCKWKRNQNKNNSPLKNQEEKRTKLTFHKDFWVCYEEKEQKIGQ